MQKVELPNSSLKVSRLGLGLASIHRVYGAKARRDLIALAIDLGFTHFDTARLYGDGLSESTLGKVTTGRREAVTITTKFGIYGRDAVGSLGSFGVPIRAARVFSARLGRNVWPTQDYSVGRMRVALEQSLRHLNTDYIDCLAIHEPAHTSPSQFEDLIAQLHAFRNDGTVHLAGISGVGAQGIAARWPGAFDVVQCPELDWSAEADPTPDFTFGALSPADIPGSLAKALDRRPRGSLLVSTRRPEHLRVLAKLVEP